MRIEEKYQELLRLKKEINQRMENGTEFQKLKELMLYLAQDKTYPKLKEKDNQLAMLDLFLKIWIAEKRKLPELGINEDIFYQVFNLDDVEHKYLKVQYCGLRIENIVPDEYCEQALKWLVENRVSGLAIGQIVVVETKKKEENLLYIARYLRRHMETLNALLMIQYANGVLEGSEKLLLEEADIWLEGQQYKNALDVLQRIGNPSQTTKEMIVKLRQVIENGG